MLLKSFHLALLSGILCLQVPMALSGPPLVVDDTEPVPFPQSELDVGVLFEKSAEHKYFEAPLSFSQGITEDLQFNVGWSFQRDEIDESVGAENSKSGLNDMPVGVKWRLLKEQESFPSIAIVPTIKIPIANEDKGLGSGEIDYDLTSNFSRSLNDQSNLHFNIGYSWIGDPENEDFSDVFHFGFAADYQLYDEVQMVAEVFSEKSISTSNDLVTKFNSGLRWPLVRDLVIFSSVGSRIHGDAPNLLLTAGVSWFFSFVRNRA